MNNSHSMPGTPDEVSALKQELERMRRELAAKDILIQQLRTGSGLVPSEQKAEPSQDRIVVSGIEIAWDITKGVCTFRDLPVALMWVDTTLKGLIAGLEAMVGPERFALAMQSEGRRSVESDWMIISRFSDFREGFAAIANNAAIAGWGRWQLISCDYEKKECLFRAHNNWEGLYQKSMNVCWGSGLLAGKLAGICAKLFGTGCWATQTAFTAKGDAYDEFQVLPSERNIEEEISSMLESDPASRADMAVALHRLMENEASLRRQIALNRRTMDELNAAHSAALNLMEDAVDDQRQAEHLNQELRKSEERYQRLAQRLESIREEERKRLARELHDDIGQILTALKIDLVMVENECRGQDAVKSKVCDMQRLLSDGIQSIHALCRRLRPGALDDLGLGEALAGLVEDWKARNAVECSLHADIDEGALSDAVNTAVFRMVQEALTNVSRYAHASKVEISLVSDDQLISVSVADNGCGMEAGAENKPTSFGLLGMRERFEVLNGTLNVESDPGKGTRIEGSIPLANTADSAN